ncbi:DNA helicase UvrD [Candidatus Collierbacteria bacterium]|nr:DNA helicase UvrD [Candidatus Collierbacteria bacterium]
MQIIADLQLHSKYSRAVSPQMTIPNIGLWSARKGIGLVATGDWTHPLWIREIQANLEETGNGLLKLKNSSILLSYEKLVEPLFLLATEVSCIYSQGGKLRRVHVLIWVPSISSAEKIIEAMNRRGCKLGSDGRPIIGMTLIQISELVLSIEPKALLIPAHAWTPWFSVYGSLGGFDTIEEAFGPFSKNIYAVETGLSSNPSMNWRIKELDNRAILSFSDAHSGPKIGREATVFQTRNNEQKTENNEITYDDVYGAIAEASLGKNDGNLEIGYTLEFYPEEGKYHYTGHRACGVKYNPQETIQKGIVCPVCHRNLTQGVMQRVEELAGRTEDSLRLSVNNQMISSKTFPNKPPFAMLVPLQEIIAEAIGSPVQSTKTQSLYLSLVEKLGGEFEVLLRTKYSEIAGLSNGKIAEGIMKVRSGDIVIDPGFDGVFGVVKIWKEEGKDPMAEASKEQLSLFQ